MAERSFVEEVKKLRLGAGEVFRGEGILAVTKALLESGVAYVAGYQGAPISHLMDVLADAQDILAEHGMRFENSASEATAAATLAASVNYPMRGAVTFKSTVGTNVASDALANLASGGVTGGALIVVGEDYGEGSSIMQERSHAFAMKSQIWLLDPRPNLPSHRRGGQARLRAFGSEPHAGDAAAAHPRLPRARALRRERQRRPSFTAPGCARKPGARREPHRAAAGKLRARAGEDQRALARGGALHRGAQAQRVLCRDADDIGIIVQGGTYNTLLRALERLGLADVYGRTQHPAVRDERGVSGDRQRGAALLRRQACGAPGRGRPAQLHRADMATILRQAGSSTVLHGKDMLPMAGEYTAGEVLKGARAFLERYGRIEPRAADRRAPPAQKVIPLKPLEADVHGRPPGFCTGCPERPIFTAMKLVERELGPHHVSSDIGCHLFSILPPFNLGNTTMGYGLGAAGAAALNAPSGKRAISVMGDGGFWHNGLTSGIANAVFNRSDNLTVVVDNNYTAATGGQDILSSNAVNRSRSTGHEIEQAARGVGVKWVKTMRRTYDVAGMMAALKEALTTSEKGPKVLIAQSECMLNKQRREKPQVRKALAAGERVVRERYGIDSDTCTGDHSCIRLNGCPSLSIKPNPDPLRTDPVATVLDSCVGCGLCGEVAHAAVLCPSFYRAQIVSNPSGWDRLRERIRSAVIGWLQRRELRSRERYAF